MIGRKATVGLSLLCALLFSAIAVQSASAAKSINTTAVTCVDGGGAKDFSDAHCDTKVTAGTGKWGHVENITAGTETTITVDNSTTGGGTSPAVLKGKAFGAATEITCNTVHGVGYIENINGGSVHEVKGTVEVDYSNCSVQKPAKCDVKESIEVSAIAEGVDGLGPEKNTMGVEFRADESENFTKITYIDGEGECALDGKTVNVTGSALATGAPSPSAKHSGATPIFDHEKITKAGTLLFGGVPAGFQSTGTVKMTEGNAISLTTTT